MDNNDVTVVGASVRIGGTAQKRPAARRLAVTLVFNKIMEGEEDEGDVT